MRSRDASQTLTQIAKDFGGSESCSTGWMKKSDVDDGNKPCLTDTDRAENRELKKRLTLPEQENEVLRRTAGVSVAGESAGKMMYPLVRELAPRAESPSR